jgi:hypothetical protein
MTTIQAPRAAPAAGRGFYFAMALLSAGVVAFGFGRTYAASLAPPGLPWWVHLHGAVFTSWILLFGVQTWLAGRGELKLHRRLGWASVGLAAAMLPLGIATSALCVRRGAVPSFFTPGLMLALDLLGLVGFAGLFAAAVALRGRREWHKRLMLCATVLLITPGWGRVLPLAGLGAAAPLVLTGVVVGQAGLGVLYDLATRRSAHPAYAVGLAAIAASVLGGGPLGFSAPMAAVVSAITGR